MALITQDLARADLMSPPRKLLIDGVNHSTSPWRTHWIDRGQIKVLAESVLLNNQSARLSKYSNGPTCTLVFLTFWLIVWFQNLRGFEVHLQTIKMSMLNNSYKTNLAIDLFSALSDMRHLGPLLCAVAINLQVKVVYLVISERSF